MVNSMDWVEYRCVLTTVPICPCRPSAIAPLPLLLRRAYFPTPSSYLSARADSSQTALPEVAVRACGCICMCTPMHPQS